MTLMERVKVAEAECGSIASVSRDAWMLDELKDEVGAVIPGDVLASLSVENPKRARSELRRAVQSIYARPKWASRPSDTKDRIFSDLVDVVFGLGPLQSLVEDESVTEIMVNGTKSIFIEREGRIKRHAGHFFRTLLSSERLSTGFLLRLADALMRKPHGRCPSSERSPREHRHSADSARSSETIIFANSPTRSCLLRKWRAKGPSTKG